MIQKLNFTVENSLVLEQVSGLVLKKNTSRSQGSELQIHFLSSATLMPCPGSVEVPGLLVIPTGMGRGVVAFKQAPHTSLLATLTLLADRKG